MAGRRAAGSAARPGSAGDQADQPGSANTRGRRRGRKYAADKGSKRGWRRLLSWKVAGLSALGLFLLGAIGIAVAYTMTPIPTANANARTEATIVYWDDGRTELGRFDSENRELVDIEEIPVHVRQAVVAAEDRSFYENSGFDVMGISRAAWDSLTAGGIRGGGSTITQQYVKNYYLTKEQTLTRKVKELFISIKVDQRRDKDLILQDYLNTIWFGRGTYGIETASQSYFGKSVSELSLEEGAAIAAILRSPGRYDPTLGEENARRFEDRFRYVIDGMAQIGAIDQATADDAEPPEILPEKKSNRYGGPNGYLLLEVRRELEALGLSDADIDGGGLRVVTTFNRQAQQAAITAAREERPTDSAENVHVGLAAVKPGDGALVAMYGGPDAVEQQFNNAIDAKPNGGSIVKPLTLATGLTEGISLRSRFDGDSGFTHRDLGPKPVNNQGDRSYGLVDLVTATERSINTAYVDLAMKVGPKKVEEMMVDSGIPPDTPDLAEQSGRITLGIAPMAPVDLADAYATIAAGGLQADWYTVRKVTDPSGEVLHKGPSEPVRAFDTDVAADVTYAMRQVVDGANGTGKEARNLGRPSAGKTGTHEDLSAWYAGFTPQLATAVALFRTDYSAEEPGMMSLDGVAGMDSFTGGRFPASIWTRFMQGALEGKEIIDFPERAAVGEDFNPSPPPECPEGTEGTYPDCEPIPEPECPEGTEGEFPDCQPVETTTPTPTPTPTDDDETQVPNVIGRSERQAKQALRDAGFEVATENVEAEPAQRGQVVDQNPPGGQTAPSGSVVVIWVGVVVEGSPSPTNEPEPTPTETSCVVPQPDCPPSVRPSPGGS